MPPKPRLCNQVRIEPLQTDPILRNFRAIPARALRDVPEVLAPFLADAGLGGEEEARTLCQRFSFGAKATEASKVASGGYRDLAAPQSLGSFCVTVKDQPEESQSKPEPQPASVPKDAEKARGPRGAAARRAAQAATEAALVPGAILELTAEDGREISKALKSCVELRSWMQEASERADVLSASFLAYAAESSPDALESWGTLLRNSLEEAGMATYLSEDESLEALAQKGAVQLVKHGLLRVRQKVSEVGDPVWAFLPEDQEWHPAVVEDILPSGRLKLIFIEYGKPQEASQEEIRALTDVADEGDGIGGEGECEMCERDLKLTFHHLIPKDKHPTYLGKRLPNGVEGEPTRSFLNSYGLMICRQCHNTVHSIASNEVLAIEYNSLQKLLTHPVIQRWIEFAKRRKASSGKSR
ncbi:TDRD1 [Symbiodinium sp. CCMP2592]|nr:TDRD1 [Symbiodinium sp. CCMP2592]